MLKMIKNDVKEKRQWQIILFSDLKKKIGKLRKKVNKSYAKISNEFKSQQSENN